jgi:hypothetical protein
MKYYAKGVDIDGNEINLFVGKNGLLYCTNENLVSLESNAKTVKCYNNKLTKLDLPAATYVSCPNNKLTKLNVPNAAYVSCPNNNLITLNLPVATFVSCHNNKLTELNLSNATYVICDNTCLKDILKLVLDRTINRTELELIIDIR